MTTTWPHKDAYRFFPDTISPSTVSVVGSYKEAFSQGRVDAWEAAWRRTRTDGCPAFLNATHTCTVYDNISDAVRQVYIDGAYDTRPNHWIFIDGGDDGNIVSKWFLFVNPRRVEGRYHGTWAAVTAAGKTYGIAPGAVITPIAKANIYPRADGSGDTTDRD